ncbi:MAG: hypothetical protein KAV87_07890 [Desulfobacteraceae bacterium]|nr:hypothetical protein [Desulfobacteraceae bacterium]
MTILAGIMTRSEDVQLTNTFCRSIKHAISRFPDDDVIEFRDHQAFLAKVDIGAYNEPAFLVGKTGSVSLLAGEPLLNVNNGQTFRTRTNDLETLQTKWDAEQWDIGALTRGVFCAVHYEPTKHRISFVADRLGIRPLYYWVGEQYVVFATALRILEELSEVPKDMDLRAVAEIASFGFPLSNRTPCSNVFVLKAAEILQIDNKVHSRRYWRWDQLHQAKLSENALLTEAHDRFVEAVECRLRTDKATLAFLSGGLDSRCVVDVLCSKKVTVHTFNFSLSRTQDQVFGAEFARKLGTIHTETPMDPRNHKPGFSKTLSQAWNASKYQSEYPVDRPKLVWSGEGGSVGVGHVYLNKQILALLRSGKVDSAIDVFLKQQYISLPLKLFKRNIAHTIDMIPKDGILEELESIHCEDPGRSFHLFLMLNDQRRHLADHFEEIDLNRIEFHLPFFDGDFLEIILSSPVDLFIMHRFYNVWLSRFSKSIAIVPWQTYPGHEKCPLPITDNLAHQWDEETLHTFQRDRNRILVNQTVSLLKADDFPYKTIRKVPLGLATFLTAMGLRDYGYVMKTALALHKYWKRCNGRYT